MNSFHSLINNFIGGGLCAYALWVCVQAPRNIYADMILVVLLLVAAWRLSCRQQS